MKRVFIALLVVLLLVLPGGCTDNYKIEDDGIVESDNSTDITTENQTTQPETDASEMEDEDIGDLGAGITNMRADENGKRIPFEYDGGEFEVGIIVEANGLVDNVGVLLYLDGQPVLYKIKSYDDETSYFHILSDISNQGETNFDISFTPSGFTSGETATLSVEFFPCADYIYDPSDPDVVINPNVNFLSENWLPVYGDIYFNVDTPVRNDQTAQPLVKDVIVTTEKDIDAFVDEMNTVVYFNTDTKLTTADLNGDFPYFVEYYDDDLTPTGTICTTGKDTVHIKYKVAGPEGMEIKWAFSLDYQPTLIDGEPTYALTLHKGEYYIVEMDIDVSTITHPTKLLCQWFADNQTHEVTPIILYPDSTQGE